MAIWDFVRLLAKIAHGYHVATRGMFPLEESPLVPIILGTRRDARNWIGCIAEHPLPSDRSALHLLNDEILKGDDQSECVAVWIKLFATQGTATYVLASRICEIASG